MLFTMQPSQEQIYLPCSQAVFYALHVVFYFTLRRPAYFFGTTQSQKNHNNGAESTDLKIKPHEHSSKSQFWYHHRQNFKLIIMPRLLQLQNTHTLWPRSLVQFHIVIAIQKQKNKTGQRKIVFAVLMVPILDGLIL